MKRFWIGIVFLILLLSFGLTMTCFSRDFCVPFSQGMADAAAAAQAGNWEDATEKVLQCRIRWEKRQHFLAAFTDHEPIEQIDALFSQLDIYGKNRSATDFSVICQQLRHWAQAIDESHGLKWWSLL